MFFLICFHLLNYLRPFWHNIQCIYYITYYTVYLCDIYTHTHARLHARRSVLAHAHIYKQTIRQQNKNDVCLDYPTDGGNFNPNDYTWCVRAHNIANAASVRLPADLRSRLDLLATFH